MIVEEGDWRWCTTAGRHHGFVAAKEDDRVIMYLPEANPGHRLIRSWRRELEMPAWQPTDQQLAQFVAFQLTGDE